MRRMELWKAQSEAYGTYALMGDSVDIFANLMAGEAVNVVTRELPGEENYQPVHFTITPKYDLGLHYYEVTQPPAKRPIRQPVLAINEVANWAACLQIDYSA